MAVYKTVLGDTWDTAAKAVYGDERKIDVLIDANPLRSGTLIFSAGVELLAPDITSTASTAGMTDQARWREVMANA